ncbi:cystatin C (amyloid angiopathy and cerebral hemorrhage) [Garra rufa]|uniref:cystatin C (amyloid angiopathy and cerebral hemorrhage) n=1 Tax=Garra rufa TaxID=137080 RepID=UPI003CCE6FC8
MYFKMIVPFLAVILAVANAGMTGGFKDADINEEGVKNALQFAVAQYNRQSNDAYVSEVASVVKARKQVVAGLKYVFTVNMGRTSCRKGGVQNLCTVHEDPSFARVTECNITVWTKPWDNFIKVLENTCLDSKKEN